ncbi:siphovirus ReqiPepy6 Gp37-like family protein [Streptomyces sp. A13(2022)]|uniref:siphovirus ReqiPepy6 Gp37-like family protein n=1 Tax=Streptomyces sp. A13(2022) TaxID=2964768 RepID=UPI0021DA8CCE|nr:siphovirus ReqiPepy6 Gp37-like family protein [Streptomyces sp. A13(2022)]MCU8589917.1 siphovirus ReqiPepy6 Gp37-like family protein [Streptomyces sp. A13(2022)]
MAIQLLVTDEDLVPQGDPLAVWGDLDVTTRFNEPASGSVALPAYPEVMEQLQPGNRLAVIRDRSIWCAGPMEIPQDFSYGVGTDGEAPPGKVTINFTDDLARPAGYLTWPAPASAWTAQPSIARMIRHVNAETIIRQLVTENCGPTARADRRIPNFALAPVAGVGTETSVHTRFEGLLATCRRVAIDGGGLGFRTRQTSSGIQFEVYQPADRTATARFSEGLGNLRALTYKRSAPTVTHALVTGSEEASPRAYVEVADPAAAATWWRVEQLVNGSADSDTDGELTQDGTEALAQGSAPVELATVTVDTPDLRAGRDYGLGDRVTVALPTGVEVTDLVRSIHLQATPSSGEHVTALVGSPAATSDPQMVRLVQELGRRLGKIEAR